jgi:hypothetical protein
MTSVSGLSLIYSQYRFLYFKIYVKTKVPITMSGQHTLSLDMLPAGASSELGVASTRARFTSQSISKGSDLTLHYRPSMNTQLWYTCGRPITIPADLLNKELIQFWFFVGANNVNSGMNAGDVYVSYSVQFRSPVPSLPPGKLSDFEHMIEQEGEDSESEPN